MILNVFITKNHHSRAESPQKILRQESSGGFFARNNSSYKLHKHGKIFFHVNLSLSKLSYYKWSRARAGAFGPPLGLVGQYEANAPPMTHR